MTPIYKKGTIYDKKTAIIFNAQCNDAYIYRMYE